MQLLSASARVRAEDVRGACLNLAMAHAVDAEVGPPSSALTVPPELSFAHPVVDVATIRTKDMRSIDLGASPLATAHVVPIANERAVAQ